MFDINVTLGFYCEDLDQAAMVWESIKDALDDAHSVYSEEAEVLGEGDLDTILTKLPSEVMARLTGEK